MIEIKINEATAADGPIFTALSRMFAELATVAPQLGDQVTTCAAPTTVKIDHADIPSTGAKTDAEMIFGGASETDPAVIFGGAGNGAAASGIASFPSSASTGAALTTEQMGSPTVSTAPTASPAGVVNVPPPIPAPMPSAPPPIPAPTTDVSANVASPSNVPNVQGVSSQTPSGTPPVPNNGASTVGGVVIDAEGLPWDHRIHSSSKTINAGDKKWKGKRNVPVEVRASVVNELRSALSAGTGGAVAPPANFPFKTAAELGMTPPPPAAPIPPPPAAAPAPLPPPIPVPPPIATTTPDTPAIPTPGAAAPVGNVGMPQLMTRITAATAAGQITAEQAHALAHEVSGGKVTSFPMLAIAPALIPAYWARLDALGIS